MPDYDFRALSPIDFEILSRDLIQKELGITLESFKPGKDLGIDFRYWPTKDCKLIVQCKHYVESGYNKLLAKLKDEELPKIKKLKPNRYLLSTSVPLSPANKTEIKAKLNPFIKSPGDIFGKEDLNNLLKKYPEIESQNIKLWFSSINMMEEILHSRIKNLSRDEMRRVQENARVYVKNESFSHALRILEEYHFCIISGIPGIGKTVLAEVLLLHYSNKDFEMAKISEDISEAWSLGISSRKKIYYYDDFLGQTSFSEKLGKNEGQRLFQFMKAIGQSKGTRLILTTREYILNQAKSHYETFARETQDTYKCIVDLSQYTRLIRANILFNHLYFSDLDVHYRRSILADRNYLEIIDHDNYNPRIIQLMTEVIRVRNISPANYVKFFCENLDNPLAIWEHAFEKHLTQQSRNALIVFTSLPYEVFLDDFRVAFDNYNNHYSKQFVISTSPQDFKLAIKELEGFFLTYDKQKDKTVVRYHNPSIKDFSKRYLASSPVEVCLLVRSIVYFEQLKIIWDMEEARDIILNFDEPARKLFLEQVHKAINSTGCALINVRRGDSIVKQKDSSKDLEEKAHFIGSMIMQRTNFIIPVFEEMVSIIITDAKNFDGDRGGMMRLLDLILKDSVPLSSKRKTSLVKHGKTFLMSAGYSANDLEPGFNLLKKHPTLFSKTDADLARGSLVETAEVVWDNKENYEPEELRDEASSLETMALQLGMELPYIVENINDYADGLESRITDEPYEDDYPGGRGDFEEWCSDETIVSLFSTIRDQ